MAYLSDTARTVLEAAAGRDDLSVLPFPETVKAKGGAMQKVLTGLRKRGFVRVIETDGPQRVVITSEGMAAIGADPEPQAEATAEAEAAATPAEADAADDTPAPAAEGDDAGAPTAGEATVAAGETATKPTPRAGTKQAQMIEMLKRPEGATVEQIAEATGWQHHTIRGAISGALKKKLGLTIEATRTREVGPNKTGAKGSSTVDRIVESAPEPERG